jgi:hypothetical protein
MEIITKTRIKEWGNSLGIVIPNEIVIKENLQPRDEVLITIIKKQDLSDFFGKGTGKIRDVQKEKNEARKLWKMN